MCFPSPFHATGLRADQVWLLTTKSHPPQSAESSPHVPCLGLLRFTHSFYYSPEIRYWATGQLSFVSKCLSTQEVSRGDCQVVDPKE